LSLQRALVWLAIVMVFLAYAAALPLALWGGGEEAITPSQQGAFIILVSGFGISLVVIASHSMRVLKQYMQAVHDLSPDDASALVTRLLFGLTPATSRDVMLRVQAGQADLEGPPIVHKVGGPARLVVDHSSVVVTSRMGVLQRVLGPGFHTLKPFEHVWKVVDMRPQRRTLTVDFITRDGIPASCQASIVCRIAASRHEASEDVEPRLGYAEPSILELTTSQFVRHQNGGERIADWVTDIAQGVLVTTVRESLERYRLDEFLNPQYWLDDEDGPARAVAAPQLLTELEAEITGEARMQVRARGVVIERIELGMVRPSEVAISRQWLEFWQAKLQQSIDRYEMQVTTTHEQLAENARVEAQALFVNRMLEEVQQLRRNDLRVPPQLIIASFMEVLHAMPDQGPEVQQLLFQQAESLIRIVNAVQQDDSPFASSTSSRKSS
jgi:hypothetical protein